MNRGKQISTIPIQSINIPRMNTMSIIIQKVPHFPIPSPVTKSVTTSPPPIPRKTPVKHVAPQRIIITMVLVFAVCTAAWYSPCQVNFPYPTTIRKARKAPTPEASVGVAIPKNMDPRTPSISIRGGTSDFKTINAISLEVTVARSSILIGGPISGFR